MPWSRSETNPETETVLPWKPRVERNFFVLHQKNENADYGSDRAKC
jgi:hypothetical protein